jgi:dephospho-CoA kinase
LTGPAAAGKSTTAELFGERYNLPVIHGDPLRTGLFGSGDILYVHGRKQAKFHAAIIQRIKAHLRSRGQVVFEYLAIPLLIKRLRKSFGAALTIVVLQPNRGTVFYRNWKRDRANLDQRQLFTRKLAVRDQYRVLEKLQKSIGAENYIDTTEQTPEQTVETIEKHLRQRENPVFLR